MKRGPLSGWTKVFGFTLRQHASAKGYRVATLLVAFLLLTLIPAGMVLFEKLSPSGGEASAGPETTRIASVSVVDGTPGEADLSFLRYVGEGAYNRIPYAKADSVETAAAAAGPNDLIVLISLDGDGYRFDVLIPDGSEIDRDDAEGYRGFLNQWFQSVLVMKSGLNPAAIAEAYAPTYTSVVSPEGEEQTPGGFVGEIVAMILPYVMIMLMYFLVLGYGQSVANSVVTEKTSKLMDLFLVSVKPGALMLGKLLAIALTGMIQVTAWLGGAVGGFAIGARLVRAINPDTAMGLILFLDLLGSASGLFTPVGVAVAVALLAGGFLLYCSLSAFGGSLAGKPEDLSTTNMFFTMSLVASFLIALYGGGSAGGMVSEAAWLNFVPFTAILVTPGRVLLGQVSALGGLVSLGIVLATALLIALLAGKTYSMMAFWKGNPPKPTQIFRMFKKA